MQRKRGTATYGGRESVSPGGRTGRLWIVSRAAVTAGFLGAAALIETLRSTSPYRQALPDVAVALGVLVLAGTLAAVASRPRPRIAAGGGVVVAFLLSLLLWLDPAGAPRAHVPAMPALALLFTTLAILTLQRPLGRHSATIRQFLTILAAFIAGIALLGHLYRIPGLTAATLPMPGLDALGFLVLACGVGAAHSPAAARMFSGPTARARINRRLLPAAFAIPALAGWLCVLGWRHGFYQVQYAFILLSLFTIVVFAALVLENARSLEQLDAERARSAADLAQANALLEQRVTERTRALETANARLQQEVKERRDAEERLHVLLESAPDAIFITDGRGQLLLLNARAESLFGYRRDALIAHPIEQLLAPESVAPYRAYRDQGVGGADGQVLEVTARRADGSTFPAGVTAAVLRLSGKILVVTDIRDISWRKTAEQALAASENRFRAVAETANDAIVSVNADGRVEYFNSAAERIFRRPAEEVLGQPGVLLLPERYRAYHSQALVAALAAGRLPATEQPITLEGLRGDGSEFPIELSAALWVSGTQTHVTSVMRDISRRRETEQRIQQLNVHLAKRAAELERVNLELESFSYSVSHDLRAPLRSIDGFTQALAEDYGARLDANGRHYLGRVRAAAQHMAQLIDDLIGLSRVGRAEMYLQTVNLSEIATETLAELMALEPGRPVERAITPGLKAVGDARLLRIVLNNLIGNAWKFSARKPLVRITFGEHMGSDGTAFFVQDNGVGFDMAYAKKLFGPFQRLHDPSEFPGSGIGLATVQRIIRRHGGEIWGEGAVGHGATFYFTIGSRSDDVSAQTDPPR